MFGEAKARDETEAQKRLDEVSVLYVVVVVFVRSRASAVQCRAVCYDLGVMTRSAD